MTAAILFAACGTINSPITTKTLVRSTETLPTPMEPMVEVKTMQLALVTTIATFTKTIVQLTTGVI